MLYTVFGYQSMSLIGATEQYIKETGKQTEKAGTVEYAIKHENRVTSEEREREGQRQKGRTTRKPRSGRFGNEE